MPKIFLLMIFLYGIFSSNVQAAEFSGKPAVAVMDFGQHDGSSESSILTDYVGAMASEYIIEALAESGKFDVISKDLVEEKLQEQGLSTAGIISPGTLKKIGEILGVRYIIYGNVNDVNGDTLTVEVFSNGANVHKVQAHIIARMTDVETGTIITAAKGYGKSESARIKAGSDTTGYITVGTKKISQVSVHNAVKKAAYSTVDIIVARFFES